MSKCVHFVRFVNRDEPLMTVWIEFGSLLYTIESIRSLKIYLCHRLEQYYPTSASLFSPFHIRLVGIESTNLPDSQMKCLFKPQHVLVQPMAFEQCIGEGKPIPSTVTFYFSDTTKYIPSPTSKEQIAMGIHYLVQ